MERTNVRLADDCGANGGVNPVGNSVDMEGWKTAGSQTKRGRGTGQAGISGQQQRQQPSPNQGSKKSASPARARKAEQNPSSARDGAGSTRRATDQGDGRVVFQQLKSYLSNGASATYVQQTVLRLHDMAADRRFKAYVRAITVHERGLLSETELRTTWTDDAPVGRQVKYEGIRSFWDLNTSEHQDRLVKLLRDWVLRDKEPQRELEDRLQFFQFKREEEDSKSSSSRDDSKRGKQASYLEVVENREASATAPSDSLEQTRLRTLCLKQFQPTLLLRERTADEVQAIVMILNHEIEVPEVPSFLTQSMDPGELACFEDLFMALEYPVYAHLEPGQRFFDNMVKGAILAQIYVGAEAATQQKRDLHDFKRDLSRITIDMETRVVKVMFKGRQTAARWIGWQMPLAGRLLKLIDYEQILERARTTNELVMLDFYSFEVEVHKGSLTSRDMYWVLTNMMGLQVQAMAHASSVESGVKEQQWKVRIQATACPVSLRGITRLVVENSEVTIHQNAVHVNWPCKRCHDPGHPFKYCKTLDANVDAEQKKHTKLLDGRLPSSLGKSSREYTAGEHPRTMEQLEALLRKEGTKAVDATTRTKIKSPKNAARHSHTTTGGRNSVVQTLSLPSEWGQSLSRSNRPEVTQDARQRDTLEGQAKDNDPWDNGMEMDAETQEESTDGQERKVEDKVDEDMQDAERKQAPVGSYEAAVRATRAQQRQQRLAQNLTARGRSPTTRARTTSKARKKQQEDFRQRSKEIQIQLERASRLTSVSVLQSDVAAADSGHGARGKTAFSASVSPHKKTGSSRANKRELDYDEYADQGQIKAENQEKARSLSPKRRVLSVAPEGGKVAMQQFMHQFMVAVTGRTDSIAEGRPNSPNKNPEVDTDANAKEPTQEVTHAHDGTPVLQPDAASSPSDSTGCSIIAIKPSTDNGAPLEDWLKVLRGTVTDVAANGHCGWLAFYASLYNVTEGLIPPASGVVMRANMLKKQILNAMMANLEDEMRFHPAELQVELGACGGQLDAHGTHQEQLCALVNHYAAQRNKSVKGTVPMHFWVRPAHLKAMAMHARETVYVLDVQENGTTRMQAYGYHEVRLSPEEVVETGTVCPIPTVQAMALLADLLEEGIRPPVLVLRWKISGNHFQAIIYDNEEHRHYSDNLVTLAERRNSILEKHGWKMLDVIAYDDDKTAKAAASALTAIRKAANYKRSRFNATDSGRQSGDGPDGIVAGRDQGAEEDVDCERGRNVREFTSGGAQAGSMPQAKNTTAEDSDVIRTEEGSPHEADSSTIGGLLSEHSSN